MSDLLNFFKKIHIWIEMSLIFLSGVAACNIFHFAIEDYYRTNMIGSILLGFEYSVSQSILAVSGFCYLVLAVLRKVFKIDSHLNIASKKILLFLALCCAVSIFTYLSLVVHGFFSGKSETGGLFRVIVTTSFSGVALFFIANRLSVYSNLAKWRTYCEYLVLALTNVMCVCVTLHFASPNKLAEFRKDLVTLSEIEKFADAAKEYCSKNGHLPNNSEQLQASGYLKEYAFDLQKIHYLKKSDNTFSVSADFFTSSQDFRRVYAKKFLTLNYQNNTKPFQKGRFCYTYQLQKNVKNGSNSFSSVLISSNIVINH